MAAKYKKRADGRYLVQIQIGTYENGKPKYKNIYARTQTEIEKKAAAFRLELEKGIIVDDQNLTVATWSREWIETYKVGRAYNTVETYRHTIDTHIIPAIGHYKLKDLKTHHVQAMINKKADEGLTRTLEKIKLTLNQILKQAIQNEFIYKNVCDGLVMPKKEKFKKRALTEEEKSYIDSADLTLKERTFLKTLLYTGLRRGEILALTRNDMDLKNKTILVNKVVIFKVNEAEIKNCPKSDAGFRTVPILDELFPLIQEYYYETDTIYIFPSSKGELMSKCALARFWQTIIKKLKDYANKESGLLQMQNLADDITPHIFRHSYATMLYYAGVDIKTAQYLLGHNSIQMTMDIYTHLDIDKNKDAVRKINQYLQPKINQILPDTIN